MVDFVVEARSIRIGIDDSIFEKPKFVDSRNSLYGVSSQARDCDILRSARVAGIDFAEVKRPRRWVGAQGLQACTSYQHVQL
ncbi:MAG: hypothetical protein E5V40_09820 [Mesorhizobium sp.]|nr:MAG: hypothetical protein E5V40_09820 [Mesorhizobium sp.]